ncbi:hypothetical protein [Caudoviricetes sp.]|nr:hypothetical protein [Caudoviricetes sp.]
MSTDTIGLVMLLGLTIYAAVKMLPASVATAALWVVLLCALQLVVLVVILGHGFTSVTLATAVATALVHLAVAFALIAGRDALRWLASKHRSGWDNEDRY